MDQRIIDILDVVENEENPSQRLISKKTGLAIGTVNKLLKICVAKGFVKLKKINSRKIHYLMTAEGIKEKIKNVGSYVKRSYQEIMRFSRLVEKITNHHLTYGREIWLLADQDEIFGLVTSVLKEMGINYKTVRTLDEIEQEGEIVVYYWEAELEESISGNNCENIYFENLLKFRI